MGRSLCSMVTNRLAWPTRGLVPWPVTVLMVSVPANACINSHSQIWCLGTIQGKIRAWGCSQNFFTWDKENMHSARLSCVFCCALFPVCFSLALFGAGEQPFALFYLAC